jgi:hypothetical protein
VLTSRILRDATWLTARVLSQRPNRNHSQTSSRSTVPKETEYGQVTEEKQSWTVARDITKIPCDHVDKRKHHGDKRYQRTIQGPMFSWKRIKISESLSIFIF